MLDVLKDGEFTYPLDNGCQIRVSIRVDKAARRATIDFSGTSSQHSGNYNAPAAVCKAAVLYVFRTLVDDAIPLNEGCLKPLDIIIPPRSIISPEYPAAVIAGNTEVSQGVTDALYGALGVLASSQARSIILCMATSSTKTTKPSAAAPEPALTIRAATRSTAI